ncbi:predicted protein [Pyrenophora tritici-repentis Pt-1C-BFP]|uniref:Uncharacterized protein n=1 Tax=Pyrenophora tritici-repentis (strain Pt-1C-BFP) TaxID=426418 RepID=B2W1H3_PYRTR|nr:uncharacterized protein PTRG_04308 [Pyrenophora tritici-repentis Pt-1C-BFP]EDU47146.1 predicted protein [Pyrenophora tritici-repentis Pt-1C-BFP]
MRQDCGRGCGQVRLGVVLRGSVESQGAAVLGQCLGRKLSQDAHARAPPPVWPWAVDEGPWLRTPKKPPSSLCVFWKTHALALASRRD